MALQQVVPYTRVLLFAAPLYFGLAAMGLAELVRRAPFVRAHRRQGWIFAAAALGLTAVGIITLLNRQPPRGLYVDLQQALEQVRPFLSGGVPLVVGVPLSEPLLYHAERAGLPRRSVREYVPEWPEARFAGPETIYLIEEMGAQPKNYISFGVTPLKVSHAGFKKFYEPPEKAGETETTTTYRLRRRLRAASPRARGEPMRERPDETETLAEESKGSGDGLRSGT
jgi:hypothetical protein